MKEKTNKKLLIILICALAAAAIVCIILWIFVFKGSSDEMKKPFENLRKDEISKVVMCDNYGDPKAELNDKEIDEFIGLLRKIETGKTATDTQKDGFASAKIKIEYKSGEEKVLGPNDDIFCIDGTAYETESGSCNALAKMRSRVLDENASKNQSA